MRHSILVRGSLNVLEIVRSCVWHKNLFGVHFTLSVRGGNGSSGAYELRNRVQRDQDVRESSEQRLGNNGEKQSAPQLLKVEVWVLSFWD